MTSSDNHRHYRAYKIIAYAAGGALLLIVAPLLLGLVVKLLWNATLADLFAWPPISFWQAVGLFLLAKIFFGFGATGAGRRTRRRRRPTGNGRTGNDEPPTDDEAFRRFWNEQGREAYEAFRASGSNREPPGP